MNATNKQIHYIECLAIDLQMDKVSRNAHICTIINRRICFLDELTIKEAFIVIDEFKKWKEELQ